MRSSGIMKLLQRCLIAGFAFSLLTPGMAEIAGLPSDSKLLNIQEVPADYNEVVGIRSLSSPISTEVSTQSLSPIKGSVQSPAEWGLDRIDQRALPLDDSYKFPNQGSGVNVYIINSGISAASSEFGHLDGRPGNRLVGAYSFDGSDPLEDCLGFGTHAAGVVGGLLYGVAKNVTLHSVKVFNCTGSTPLFQILESLDWVAKNHVKPAVVLYLTYPTNNQANEVKNAAVAALVNAGVPVVVGSGSQDADACNLSPANSPFVISVAGIDSTDAREPANGAFQASNWGPCVDMHAPGENITSAWIGSADATAKLSGTNPGPSFVTGAAALVLGVQPKATPAEVANALYNLATPGVLTGLRNSTNRLLYIPPTDSEVSLALNPFGGTLYAVNMQFGMNSHAYATTNSAVNLAVASFNHPLLQPLNASSFSVTPSTVSVLSVTKTPISASSYLVSLAAPEKWTGKIVLSLSTGNIADAAGIPLNSSITPLTYTIVKGPMVVGTIAHDAS